MPDTRISDLTVLTAPAAGDLIPIVDISDTTMAASGTTKRVTQADLSASFLASAQPLDATLTALAAVTTAADKVIYATGVDTFATTDLTSVSRTLLAQTTQALMRTTGLGLGTIATQAASSVAITGGTINGATVGATTPATGAFTSLSATGITTVAAGTAALPSIVSTTGTADTGLLFPAADTLAASTAGVERIRIGSTGNVGIGTTSPANTLQVIGSARFGSASRYVRVQDNGAGQVAIEMNGSDGNLSRITTDQNDLWLNPATGTVKIGAVGVLLGTLSSVYGTYYSGTGYGIRTSNTTAFENTAVDINTDIFVLNHTVSGGRYLFDVLDNGISRLRIVSATGNVGIGTSSPNANAILDVSSTTKAFMPPRMTTTQKNAIASPTAGMVVYDSTLNKLCVRAASAWETVTSV